MQEDFERLLIAGTASGGEWFMDGVRIPNGEALTEAGDSRGESMEDLRDAASASVGTDAATAEPLFKDIDLVLLSTTAPRRSSPSTSSDGECGG